MFRQIMCVLLVMSLGVPAFAADYEINLSALDALGSVSGGEEDLPLPAASVEKAQSKNIKKTSKVVAQKTVKKSQINKKVPSVKKTESSKTLKKVEKVQSNVEITEVKSDVNSATSVVEPVIKTESKVEQETVAEQKTAEILETPEKEPMPVEVSEDKKENATSETNNALSEQSVPVMEENTEANENEEVADEQSSVGENSAMLVFKSDSADLGADIVNALNRFAKQYGEQNTAKVNIETYNYDDGMGSFSRKRLSLNRAVAVRSHLLGMGLKSFGIQIINTEDDAFRNNVLVSY